MVSAVQRYHQGPRSAISILPSFANSWRLQFQIASPHWAVFKSGRKGLGWKASSTWNSVFFPQEKQYQMSPSRPLLLSHWPDMGHRPTPRDQSQAKGNGINPITIQSLRFLGWRVGVGGGESRRLSSLTSRALHLPPKQHGTFFLSQEDVCG